MRKEMKEKRRRKLLPAMLAVALAAVMIVPMGKAFAYVPVGDGKGTITVNLQKDEDGTFGQDLTGGTYGKIAFYQIAEGTPNESYDTLDWALNDEYKDDTTEKYWKTIQAAKSTSEVEDAYNALAEAAQAKIVGNPSDFAGTIEGNANIAEKSLPLKPGIYLAVPMQKNADGAYEVKAIDGKASVTTNEYVYTFSPMMISVPTKNERIDTAEDGSTTISRGTAFDYGDWVHDVQITTKAGRKYNTGKIAITKELLTIEKKENAAATFVFSIEATKGEEKVYSNVVSIGFTDYGSQTRVVDGIPVGANVTVTEVYSGHSYELTTDASQTKTTTVEANKINGVSFTNDYDHTFHGGGGIENQITKSGEDWDVTGQVKSGTTTYNDDTGTEAAEDTEE